jgi:hypothetical protein
LNPGICNGFSRCALFSSKPVLSDQRFGIITDNPGLAKESKAIFTRASFPLAQPHIIHLGHGHQGALGVEYIY